MEYVAIQPLQCDFGAYEGLDGYYQVEEYRIIPCEKVIRSEEKPFQTILLVFPFEGLEGVDAQTHFQNRAIMAGKAKKFVAWLVVATGVAMRLYHIGFGGASFGKGTFIPRKEFVEEKILKEFQADITAKEGKYEEIFRPDLSAKGVSPGTTLKLPLDFPRLTRKLFSLPVKMQRQYIDACLSFQFGLENWGAYPTVTLVAFVSAVESIMAEEFTSGYCEDAKKICQFKKDITKKFRAFFERTLIKPLPEDLRNFLNETYSKRSTFTHKALLGEIGLCGTYGEYSKTSKLYSELRFLFRLIRAGLIQWLTEI